MTLHYDPMIAKLIARGPTRESAAATLAEACRQVEVWPVKTNAAFLARCLEHPDFLAGRIDTGFIGERLESLVPPPQAGAAVLSAAAQALIAASQSQPDSPWTRLTGFRANVRGPVKVWLNAGSAQTLVELAPDAPLSPLSVLHQADQIIVFEAGAVHTFPLGVAASTGGEGGGDGQIHAPMPGRIAQVRVAVGGRVVKGQALIVLEAMKMEHALNAPFDGVVETLTVKPGDQVSEGVLLLRVSAAD